MDPNRLRSAQNNVGRVSTQSPPMKERHSSERYETFGSALKPRLCISDARNREPRRWTTLDTLEREQPCPANQPEDQLPASLALFARYLAKAPASTFASASLEWTPFR